MCNTNTTCTGIESTENSTSEDIDDADIGPGPSLTVGKNVGSKRNILILGTAKAGKYTIARNSVTDDKGFPANATKKGAGEVHVYEHEKNTFIAVDTAGAHTEKHRVRAHPTINYIRSEIESQFQHGINLIIFVVRMDCCTPEELDFLVSIVQGLFSYEAREYMALIHSGCENLSDEECRGYKRSFAGNAGPAGQLTSFCQKGALCVGLPALDQLSEKYGNMHNDVIERSKRELRNLIRDAKTILPCAQLLKSKNCFNRENCTMM